MSPICADENCVAFGDILTLAEEDCAFNSGVTIQQINVNKNTAINNRFLDFK
jgi:hypothetical protein